MCEGHVSVLQNYLREQHDNLAQIDLVALSAQVLHIMVERIDDKTLPLVIQV